MKDNSKKKKVWVKPKEVIVRVGDCKYCNKEILNTDSFVSFYPKGHAHYDCMKKDYENRTQSNGE